MTSCCLERNYIKTTSTLLNLFDFKVKRHHVKLKLWKFLFHILMIKYNWLILANLFLFFNMIFKKHRCKEFFQYFGKMTHTHGIGNFSGVLLRIWKKNTLQQFCNDSMNSKNNCLGWQTLPFNHFKREVTLGLKDFRYVNSI